MIMNYYKRYKKKIQIPWNMKIFKVKQNLEV